MTLMKRRPLLCLLLLFATGCFSETRTYSVMVRNRLDTPVTICMTKTNGPVEPDWLSPETLAAPPHPATDNRPPGAVIPPGKTAIRNGIAGRFYSADGRATLRVYAGNPNLSEMNAISRGNADRLDIPLYPGQNSFEISQASNGLMHATEVKALTANAQEAQH